MLLAATGCPDEKGFDTGADPDTVQITFVPTDNTNGDWLRVVFAAWSNGETSTAQSTITVTETPSAGDLVLYVEPGEDVYASVTVVLEEGEGDSDSANVALVELVNECHIQAGQAESVKVELGYDADGNHDLDVQWVAAGDAGCTPLSSTGGLGGGGGFFGR